MEGPHPHSVSTRTTDARWRPGPRKGLESRGAPWRRRCENGLDGSAACHPITRGFSPPGYNLVLRRCRHPRAVPLAFGDSAQFVDLAQFAVNNVFCAVYLVDSWHPVHLLLTAAATSSWTRDACRSRLDSLRAHNPSRAYLRPTIMRTVGTVVYSPSQPHPLQKAVGKS